jgi:hypothetical protein
MILLVSGGTATVRRLAAEWPRRLGMLLTPANRNGTASLLATGLPWAADNGCYRGLDAPAFRRMLRRVTGLPRCLFVVVPDVVGDARATLGLFDEWREEVAATSQPPALVGQDGAEDLDIPWGDFACWFVGGSTRWKLSRASADLCRDARSRGKHVHMGRCNSRRRMGIADSFGVDSIDGSSFSRWTDKYLEKSLRWLGHLGKQRMLFGEGAR